MSYEVHYHPTEEAMEKYKPWQYDEKFYKDETQDRVKTAELELLVYCLENHSEDLTYKVINQIKLFLQIIGQTIEEQEKAKAYDNWKKEGELWYCGRDFENTWESIDDFIDLYLSTFTILAKVVPTANYFEVESEFFDKQKEIECRIEGFSDSVRDSVINKITEDLKEFKENPYSDLEENE